MKRCPKCKGLFDDRKVFCTTDGERLISGDTETLTGNLEGHLTGRVLDGKYRLERQIGRGGMGLVYIGLHTQFTRQFAIKLLLRGPADDPSLPARFRQEAEAAARIRHPNVVQVSDFGQTSDDLLYMVMEYVEGKSFRRLLEEEKRLDPRRAVELSSQICSAIAAAHRAGVVHRDLKPENVMVEVIDGREMARVLDFGIARLKDAQARYTLPGGILGTPAYMSPEQCQGGEIDHRSDIYSLGVMLYEMLSGRPPFEAETWQGLMVKHINQSPEPLDAVSPGLPAPLTRAVMRALEKSASKRHQEAAELAEELRTALATAQGSELHTAVNDATTAGGPADVFISYCRNDSTPALDIAEHLESSGVTVWVDRFSIEGGANYGFEISKAIKDCKILLLCCSDASMRSREVKQEILLAWRHEKPILPLLFEPTNYPEQLEYFLVGLQWIEIMNRPSAQWIPRVEQALARVGITTGQKGVTGRGEAAGWHGIFRGLGAVKGNVEQLNDSPEPSVQPFQFESGLDGLRAVARFTNQIWPVPARPSDASANPIQFRGLGASQKSAQHGHRLGSRVRLVIESDREGYLLLLDEGPEGITYCLCPSHFAPDTRLRKGQSNLPQEGAMYDSFEITGTPGREQLLAIITDEPLRLDWMPDDLANPARVLHKTDIELLLRHLRSLEPDRWTALSTYFDIIA